MNLTKEKLKSLYEKKYSKNNDISKRFVEIGEIIDNFINLDLKDYTNRIKQFTSYEEGILEGDSKACLKNMIDKENKHEDLIKKSWKLLAGYDKNNPVPKYRIISNNFTKPDFDGKLHTSGDMSIRVNGNFASNNYFFQVANFLQNSKKGNTFNYLIENSKMVLTWYKSEDLGGSSISKDDAFRNSKKLLDRRFPPKFLWMWANKDTVIHPVSLMAFRHFLNSQYGQEVLQSVNENYTPEKVTNMKFDDFVVVWKNISDTILQNMEIDKIADVDNKVKAIAELSKLISQISIEETDIKNISDLLTTGNKAVILWGPPGTGKTYESIEVVKELLEVDETLNDKDIEDKYLFSKGHINRNDKGFYEIVQFHPNYTYQEFIGGISPKLDEDDKSRVLYELRAGIFKKFCDDASKKENNNKKFIFIIDEINRAELSAVFGELLLALEYRGKSIQIPYFKESFRIPRNVYIIGTMNNVDKSLVTFDLALRRRFGFFKLMPKLEIIKDVLSEIIKNESLNKYYDKCVILNNKITHKLNLGEDYQIGQAYFLKIKDFLDPDKIENKELQIITSFELEKLWVYNIEPLLEEYLGMSIEDDDIQKQLKDLKDEFLKDS